MDGVLLALAIVACPALMGVALVLSTRRERRKAEQRSATPQDES